MRNRDLPFGIRYSIPVSVDPSPFPSSVTPLDYFQYYSSSCLQLKDVTRVHFDIFFAPPPATESGSVPGVDGKSSVPRATDLLFFSLKCPQSFDVLLLPRLC